MIILFEEYSYPVIELLTILEERHIFVDCSEAAKIKYVGYYYSASIQAATFIFPKVFLKKDQFGVLKGFGIYDPIDLLLLAKSETASPKKHFNLGVDKVAILVLKAIKKFIKIKFSPDLIASADFLGLARNGEFNTLTELELAFAFFDFNRKNPSLFRLVQKKNNSGRGRPNWNRTIYKTLPLVQSNTPIYTLPKHIAFIRNPGDDIIIIFYSILKNYSQVYNTEVSIPDHIKLLAPGEINKLIRNGQVSQGKVREGSNWNTLKLMVELINLYLDRKLKVSSLDNRSEELLVKNFNIVFESIIDELLVSQTLPTAIKQQKDGKLVDHVYEYRDLFGEGDSIYYIGDSKYYLDPLSVGGISIYKQFTYAKNVIQYAISKIVADIDIKPLKYRDDLTEGYNITPNFFISANFEGFTDLTEIGLVFNQSLNPNRHFIDRLFDRDTLLLQSYSINFLYLLNNYVTPSRVEGSKFQLYIKETFRNNMIDYLNENYFFYDVCTHETISKIVSLNFKMLAGRMYRPGSWENRFILAVEKTNRNVAHFRSSLISQNCIVQEYIPE